ncbi:hypothetical protein GCM10009117_06230 [Gangjinia marincola]|uniref:Secretion system C-terminal sorting domain-containing protein n=1 Tax=Gangjinia marincola TaxID=578463 RepID=A0ABP3XT85_9FLAO
MKQYLLLFLFFISTLYTANAQSISLVGSAVNGWPDDIFMDEECMNNGNGNCNGQGNSNGNGANNGNDGNNQYNTDIVDFDLIFYTDDNIEYYTNAFYTNGGEARFREDGSWDVQWSADDFPSGTADESGKNVAIPPGYWKIRFNRQTAEYTFEEDDNLVGLVGPGANGWPNGNNATDIGLNSRDLEEYTLKNFETDGGDVKFRYNLDWTTNWGSDDFPSGIGVQDGADIAVPPGVYDITFNRITGAFSFADSALSVDEVDNATTVRVFPNPTTDQWVFSSSKETIQRVEIYNVLGKRVLSSRNGKINASNLSSGVYMARIATENQQITLKVIKR